MKRAITPFNLSLLVPTPGMLARMRPVTSLDIFEGAGGNFHENGLFSTLTFGPVGSPRRESQFSYISLKCNVFHPVVFTRLIKLRALYKEIIAGETYVVWNDETEDFDRATALTGQTGYTYFLANWHRLNPKKSGSPIRDLRVDLINKNKEKAFLREWFILPAALRDIDIDADGRHQMDEINELYQKTLMLVRSIPEGLKEGEDLALYDRTRYSLTLRFVEIFEYIESLLSGKNGFIQARWASRRVFNGTRNVITSMDTTVIDLNQPNRARFNDTVIGIHQMSRAVLPKSIYFLTQSVSADVFSARSNNVELIEPKSLRRVWAEVSNDEIDRWSTPEGLESVINEISHPAKRHRPVKVGVYYLALVYVDDKANFKVLRDIDDLPPHLDRKWVRPITYVELIYISGYRHWNTFAGFVTRYPIENQNSSIPTNFYVKTTTAGDMRYELGDDWERLGDDYVAMEYPRFENTMEKTNYIDSASVHPTRLKSLGADQLGPVNP